MTDWRAFAEELLRALDDARQEIANLDVIFLDLDGKTAKVVGPDDPGGDPYLETFDVEQVIEDLVDDWRRKLWVAQLVDDRERVTS